MADNLGLSPGQPKDAEFPGEMRPAPTKDCASTYNAGGWGRPVTTHEYIWYGNSGEDDYPTEACEPWYHQMGKINSLFIVNPGTAGATAGITGTGGIAITGDIFASNATFTGTCAALAFSAQAKLFDISHPTKEEHRLRHACLEGPEHGVYHRGRLTNKNVIELPEYWRGLVDPESITVTLTQIGSSQDLIVEAIEWGRRVKVRSGNASNIDCYYTVNGTRKDVPELEVEYSGPERQQVAL